MSGTILETAASHAVEELRTDPAPAPALRPSMVERLARAHPQKSSNVTRNRVQVCSALFNGHTTKIYFSVGMVKLLQDMT